MRELIDARGYFWWADATIDERDWAPRGAVSGRLSIDAQGLTSLELDMPLPRGEGPGRMNILFEEELPHPAICGVLTGSEERVRLWNLMKGPSHIALKGPSREHIWAQRTLVGRSLPTVGDQPAFNTLICPLEDFDDWLGPEHVAVETNEDGLTATFKQPAPHAWTTERYALELKPRLQGSGDGRHNRVEWTVTSELSLTGPAIDVEVAIDLVGRLEDLLILLTDSERGLAFPLVASGVGTPVRLFYARTARPDGSIKWHNAWVRFPQIADRFGELIERWLAVFERYGPGIHLYLGNRRGPRSYAEFRFAAFIWGLEALHRRDVPAPENPKLQEKVQRILADIKLDRDRRWAETKLPTREEPSLATRLFEVLKPLPLGLDSAELDVFAKRCTQRRNDISHFGGAREGTNYDDFIEEVRVLSDALDLLYHARILQLVGISPSDLWWWFVDGYQEYQIRRRLEAAGLTLPAAGTPFPAAAQ